MDEIILSICIATHNHENFIGDLLVSVFNQEVSFKFEVNICDDLSTDNTPQILMKLSEKYPGTIHLILNKENEGIFNVAKKLFGISKGKYLCFLDGDDRWIYSKKIQTQIDFLESNPDYSASFHDAEIISTTHTGNTYEQAQVQTHGIFKYFSQFNQYRPDFFPWDLIMRNIIPTASVIIRKPSDPLFFEKLAGTTLSLSWIMELHLIKRSKFRYFNEVWSIYNDHPGGVSKKVELMPFKMSNIENMKRLLNDDYYRYIRKDVFHAISAEYRFALFNPVIKSYNKKFFLKMLFGFIKYSFLRVCSESRYFYRDYMNKTNN